AETAQADLRPDQQAKQQVTVHPYRTFNQGQQNYLYISTGTNTVSVGERLTLQFSASVSDQSHREFIKQITYLIWDVVEHGDIGCTRGGGRDAKGVFTDAGLLYSSSTGVRTLTRQALQCPGSARRRRSAELVQRKARLESHYKEKLQRRCCKDGLRDIPMPYSCTRRSLYITEGPECILAFRYCCATYRDQVFNTEIPTTPPPMTTAPPTITVLMMADVLPYSVARNEQVEIKVVVHNYGYDEMHVRVVLMKTEGMCSVAFKERHTQEVTLPAGSSVAVPYTIVPLVVGKLPLEVMVVGRDMTGGDRIQKFLRVVVSNVLADSIDNSISEDSLASLIQMPGGCVEQNLASITLPLIATLYLDRTNNWESVGVDRRAEALRYIRRG
ncbi:hypothetical protein GOODEAATRI_011078, partial [Goodea atripinnis]